MTDDRELIRRVKGGEVDAFNDIIRKYQDKIFNAVLRHVGNYQDACDVTQAVFINAFRSIREFKEDSSLATWLHRIAYNASISFFRERGRRKALSLVTEGEDGEVLNEPAADGDPSGEAAGSEVRDKIQQALRRLDDESRQIVILREFEGYAYEEIAEVLQVPVGTVRSKLHRARLFLQEKLRSLVGDRYGTP